MWWLVKFSDLREVKERLALVEAKLNHVERLERRILNVLEFLFGNRPAPAFQILIYGGPMGLSITAGLAPLLVQLVPLPSGSVFDSPANLALTCDDPNVVIAPADGDATGTLFNVSTPASDTATSANLNATGLAGGVQISGTAVLTIVPAPPPPPVPATSIGIVAAGSQPSAPVASAKSRAPAK